jgi:hypothetical protein
VTLSLKHTAITIATITFLATLDLVLVDAADNTGGTHAIRPQGQKKIPIRMPMRPVFSTGSWAPPEAGQKVAVGYPPAATTMPAWGA